jgi:hypothetical protein
MKEYGGVDVYIHVFLTWALVGGEWERAPDTHWMGAWVDPRAGQDDMEKIKFVVL